MGDEAVEYVNAPPWMNTITGRGLDLSDSSAGVKGTLMFKFRHLNSSAGGISSHGLAGVGTG